ncbi:MerR family transcriptional regulator [Virgibacillus siamensis]|uniref:MerR family transcriptional regulator n=1 Tax=Virgibacillus siamensis TaxID=480071 RepID=UPI001FEBA684|nr:MerR family transcriptional regulator [Virgibacillus siamensis]
MGELAKLTGLTVRTLRYYDQIGLFSPSAYSDSGHRLYNKSDLSKLQQILSLKHIGLSLEDVQSVLAGSDSYSASEVLSIQITRLKEDIQVQQTLLSELTNALTLIQNQRSLSVEELTKLLGVMKMNREKYFTKDQLDQMKKQYESMDKDELKKAEQKFDLVMEKLRNHMEQGTPATDKDVQSLAKQWQELTGMFAPQNDPEFIKAAEQFHAENPGNELQHGVDAETYQYINKAMQCNKDA